jgi:niacin transporter
MNTKLRQLTITGLLVALSIVIPMFMPIKIVLPTFTMTLAAHVPSILAMFVSPLAVIFVAIGNGIGFMALGPIVVVRALTHMIFGLIGCWLIKKKANYILIGIITMLIHGVCEFFVLLAFSNTVLSSGSAVLTSAFIAFYGSCIHHAMDFAISTPIIIALYKTKFVDYKIMLKK